MKERGKQVVGGIIIENGRVFAAKRGDCRYAYVAHKYEFAGGKVEAGEDLPNALVREMKEELALDVAVLCPFVTVTHEYPDFVVTLHTFLCQRLGDYTLLEHEDARWLSASELVKEEWAPADAPILDALKTILRKE